MALQNITLPPVRAIKSAPYTITTTDTVHIAIEDNVSHITFKVPVNANGNLYIRFDNVANTDVVYHSSNPNNWDAAVYPGETIDRFLVGGFKEEQKITYMHLLTVGGSAIVDVIQA